MDAAIHLCEEEYALAKPCRYGSDAYSREAPPNERRESNTSGGPQGQKARPYQEQRRRSGQVEDEPGKARNETDAWHELVPIEREPRNARNHSDQCQQQEPGLVLKLIGHTQPALEDGEEKSRKGPCDRNHRQPTNYDENHPQQGATSHFDDFADITGRNRFKGVPEDVGDSVHEQAERHNDQWQCSPGATSEAVTTEKQGQPEDKGSDHSTRKDDGPPPPAGAVLQWNDGISHPIEIKLKSKELPTNGERCQTMSYHLVDCNSGQYAKVAKRSEGKDRANQCSKEPPGRSTRLSWRCLDARSFSISDSHCSEAESTANPANTQEGAA